MAFKIPKHTIYTLIIYSVLLGFFISYYPCFSANFGKSSWCKLVDKTSYIVDNDFVYFINGGFFCQNLSTKAY